jgi:MATE family multidrug resistance protein
MDQGRRHDKEADCTAALLPGDTAAAAAGRKKQEREISSCDPWRRRVWEESKKLWEIVGPSIFTRTATYGLNVVMQAFAGHLGDLELASVSFAFTVLAGFNYGLLVRS